MLHRSGVSQNLTIPSGTPVLGDAYKGHSTSGSVGLVSASTLTKRHTFSARKIPRMPKVPRPERVAVIFESVKCGLRLVCDVVKWMLLNIYVV